MKTSLLTQLKIALKSVVTKLILLMARYFRINLLSVAFKQVGAWYFPTFETSGELRFVSQSLTLIFGKVNKPIIFDVGSNRGDYATLVKKYYPEATVYCFEPNPNTFPLLQHACANGICEQLAFGSKREKKKITVPRENQTTGQATLVENRFMDTHSRDQVLEHEVQVETIDGYCRVHSIEHIDLLKIDTEGYELQVLRGATELIKKRKISVIQFEFNEISIFQRTFIRDFYEILPGYTFFRIQEKAMVPMNKYTPFHELFQDQNIAAVRNDLISRFRV